MNPINTSYMQHELTTENKAKILDYRNLLNKFCVLQINDTSID